MTSNPGRLFTWIALPLFVAACSPTGAAPAKAPTPESRLAERMLGSTPMIEDLRELCDRVGGRPTGSPAADRAVAWGERKLRAAGVETATEAFTVPALWLPGTAEASCLVPEQFALRIAAAPYSASTPGAGLEAKLVDAGQGGEADFARLGASSRGAVALVRSDEMKSLADLFAEYMRTEPMLDAARKAGVSALLLMSTRPRGLLYRHPVNTSGGIVEIPVAIISREQGARLARLLERGEVRVRLAITNKTGGPYEARNVIGEIKGREKPAEIVLLGAHIDSWDMGTGAQDNGVNVATVIDVARAMKEMGLAPRRTIRFALFNGEEQGMWGSAGYVHRHRDEMDDHAAVVIFDIGSGHINGFYLNGREELRAPVTEALAGLATVAGVGPFRHNIEAVDGTDNFDFLLSGVPNLIADQEPAPYLPDYHAESDVFEKVDVGEARGNAAIAAALVWALAESPKRPAARQTRAEVEALITRTGLDAQMKAFGQWDDWVNGRRGESR